MKQATPADLVITAPWILPVVPRARIFSDCAIVITGGRIVSIVTQDDGLRDYLPKQTIHLDNHVLMPGLVNAHGHAAMALLRGYADDLPMMTWLKEYIWPVENHWLSEMFVRDGAALAIAEMLSTGTTCFSDMYFFPEATAEVAREAGLRAQIAFPIFDFSSAWAKNADDYIHKGLSLYDDYRSHSRIRIAFGPHAPYTVSDRPLQTVATLSEELQAAVQIHLHETAEEISNAMQHTGARPLERMERLGLLTPLTQCVHMTQTSTQDIERLRLAGASVVHCPESNMKLASGLCPVHALQQAGIPVGLGTDGAASNNDLDMFGELATAALLAKAAAENTTALAAHDALAMATLGGARALGLDSEIGSLEPNKSADIIAVSMADPFLQPRFDLASQLVYNNRRTRVSHVWVEGRPLVHDGQLLTLDQLKIRERTAHWQAKLQTFSPR